MFCGNHMDTGKPIDLACLYREEIGWRWSSWKEMDEKTKWLKKVKNREEEYMVDLVETFFLNLDLY